MGLILSDTQLALASLEISLELAKWERKKENVILVTLNPAGGYSGKCRVILISITYSYWIIQEDVLKKLVYNEKQTRAGLVRIQVSVPDKSPRDTLRKVRDTYLRQALGNAVV